MAAHELVGYLLLALIALHAGAALFHHFVRRDNVLNAMLPGHRRGPRLGDSPPRSHQRKPLARQDQAF
jgi:cytochrome b